MFQLKTFWFTIDYSIPDTFDGKCRSMTALFGFFPLFYFTEGSFLQHFVYLFLWILPFRIEHVYVLTSKCSSGHQFLAILTNVFRSISKKNIAQTAQFFFDSLRFSKSPQIVPPDTLKAVLTTSLQLVCSESEKSCSKTVKLWIYNFSQKSPRNVPLANWKAVWTTLPQTSIWKTSTFHCITRPCWEFFTVWKFENRAKFLPNLQYLSQKESFDSAYRGSTLPKFCNKVV